MDAQAAGVRDAILLSVAVVLGASLASALPFVGLPIVAAGVAGLVYRSRIVAAGVAVALGAALVFAGQGLESAVFVAIAIAAVLLAVVLLPRRSVQFVGALTVGLLTLGYYAQLVVMARGLNVSALFAVEMQRALLAVRPSVTAEFLASMEKSVAMMLSAWPALYFSLAVMTGVFVIAAIAWAARRAGRDVGVPSLALLDLTPHVLWAFVAGLLLLASSYASFPASNALGVVGLNLVLCARPLFALQGFSVCAGVLSRAGVGLGGRVLALAALAVLDALTLVVSFVGLLDFWVNFRRLPRDGVTLDTPTQAGA